MNLEMRRVVEAAGAAAQAGWDDQAVESLATSTRMLRCDEAELTRLLKLPPSDHGFREEVFTTSANFHASVFALAAGETIPLHDHPGLDVISKVLRGRVRVETFEWREEASLRAVACAAIEIGVDDEPLVLRRRPGTLHSVTAVASTAFLDLFSPYYDDDTRPCQYYEVAEQDSGTVHMRVISWDEAHR